MTIEGKQVAFCPITLDDLKTTGGDLSPVAPPQFGNKTMIPLDQCNAAGGSFQDMGRERPHSGTDFHKMIIPPRLQTGDNRPCQIRIEKKILPQHFAWPDPYLIKA